MDLHQEPIAAERRARTEAERREREAEPTPDDYIHAAQFMLSTRQREEAVLRATHLAGETPAAHEDRARETLAEMIHLQELITARTAEPGTRRSRGDTQRVIDLDARSETTSSAAAPTRSRTALLATIVAVLLLAAAVAAAWQFNVI